MKKVFYAALAMFVVMAFAVISFSGTMMVSADDIPEFENNIALQGENGGIAFASSIYDDGNKETQHLNDGKQDDTYYWQPDGTDVKASYYAGIYWEGAKTFNTVVVEFRHFGDLDAAFSVTYATANAGIKDDKTASDRTFKNAADGVTFKSGLVKGVDYTVTPYDTGDAAKPVYVITFAAPVTSNMVKLDMAGHFSDGCADAPTEIYEIEVYNVATEETVIGDKNVEAETDVVAGLKSVFVATNVAKADLSANACIKASYTITKADGTKAKGVKFITSAYKSIALGEEVITAEDADDYVTGILFNNVNEDATVEVVFTVAYN